MTRSIEALTPLERKQMLERLIWEHKERGFSLIIPIDYVGAFIYHGETIAEVIKKASKLTTSESDELDNCVL